VCTYETEIIEVSGSAKGPDGWIPATTASIYFDHPVHFPAGHALMIDVLCPSRGPSARVALELDPETARSMAEAILRTLQSVPDTLLTSSKS
jgi:hypothetical protein